MITDNNTVEFRNGGGHLSACKNTGNLLTIVNMCVNQPSEESNYDYYGYKMIINGFLKVKTYLK